MKKLLLGICLLTLVGLPVALVLAVCLCFQDEPLVRRTVAFTPADIERGARIVEAHDPRKQKSGTLRTMSIRSDDLDLAANYLANRFGRGSSRIVLKPGVLSLAASVEVPTNPLGRYVNVQALLRETGGVPAFEELRIGRLPVPSFIADWALAHALHSLDRTDPYKVAADTLKSVSIADGNLRIVYEWRDDLPSRVGGVLLTPADRDRMKVYHEYLVQWSRDASGPRNVSLADVLRPLLELAARRASASGGDAQAESRALIVVVTFFVNGKGLAAIVPEAKDWPQPVSRKVTLNGRGDSPQHFTISAALAAHAGTPLSDAIGLYKEIDDSQRGSGFSFNDLAADRAGTRFGELATRSAASARQLQQRAGAGLRERDFMPDAADLAENMPEAEFNRRFGGVDSPAYRRIMEDIERRVAACPLYRGPSP